jgi:hypothetical protein
MLKYLKNFQMIKPLLIKFEEIFFMKMQLIKLLKIFFFLNL